MFRPMRRIKQQIPESEAMDILRHSNTCTLALFGDDGYPYSLPINYVFVDGKIYFHGANEGHKYDAIDRNPKVSLSVIAQDEIYQQKYTNRYKSVIVFGTARLLTDRDAIYKACYDLAASTCPDAMEGIPAEIEDGIDDVAVVEITPQHITGKEGLELYKLRQK